jgi:hypothetical protein
MKVKYPTALICAFLWIGFVSAISFMEAWLKFRAPGITIPLGLGIGRLVFSALNKVEWVLALAILINLFLFGSKLWSRKIALLYLTLILLILQTFWLLPLLDARAELHIQNQIVPPSNLHFYYVGMEVVKVVCLSIFGVSLLKITTI